MNRSLLAASLLALVGCACESALCLTVLRLGLPALDEGAYTVTVSVDGDQRSCEFVVPLEEGTDSACFVDPVGEGFEVGMILSTLVDTPGEVLWSIERDDAPLASGVDDASWTDPPKNNRCGNACIGGELELSW